MIDALQHFYSHTAVSPTFPMRINLEMSSKHAQTLQQRRVPNLAYIQHYAFVCIVSFS